MHSASCRLRDLRLHQFAIASDAFIVAPGGIGTVLEMVMIWQLLQVRHLQETPLILVGPTWPALIEWARQAILAFDPPLADAEDLAIPRCVASADEALAIIQAHHATWLRARPTGSPSPPSSRTRATPGASRRRPSRTASRLNRRRKAGWPTKVPVRIPYGGART